MQVHSAQPAGELPSILIVDDEPRVLRSLRATLKQDYRIDAATSTAEARKLMTQGDGYSAVVSDERLPGETGHELLEWVQVHYPDTACFLLSGVNAELLDLGVTLEQISAFISKPWKIGRAHV